LSSASLSAIVKPSGSVKFEGECNYCKKIGHMSKDCRKKKKDKADRKNAKNAVVTVAEQSMPIYTYSLSDS
jgi:Zinc knuckle